VYFAEIYTNRRTEKIPYEELINFHSSPHIMGGEGKEMRWARVVICMGEMRQWTQTVKPHYRPRRRWEVNITMDP
jgi:hypothetical protein